MRVQVTRIVRAPRDRVLAYFTSPQAYAKAHAPNCLSNEILSSSGREVISQEEWQFGGRKVRFKHRIRLFIPDRLELEIIEGDGLGTFEKITFETVPEGTRIVYESDFRVRGLVGMLVSVIGRKQVRRMLELMADQDMHAIESGDRA